MAHFSTAPLEEVVPKRKQRQPSQRAQIQHQYQDAMRNAILEKHEALVVDMDPNEKPLTIRNRVKRAAEALGLHDISIRRRKNKIIAYLAPGDEA